MADTFTVAGNYGTLTANLSTGEVVEYDTSDSDYSADSNYHDIIALDVREYCTFMRRPTAAGDHDILYFGFWDDKGNYYASPWRDAEVEHGNKETA